MNRIIHQDLQRENEKKNEKTQPSVEAKFVSESVEFRDGEMFVKKITKSGAAAKKEIQKVLKNFSININGKPII